MVNKVEGLDLQHDMKKKNNKPGCKSDGPEEGKAIREGKQIVRSQD
jgi:hypothetical protein